MSGAAHNARVAAELAVGSRRAFVSHCAVCLEEHRDGGHSTGMWIDETLTRTVIYFLCGPCGRRYKKAGKKARKRTLDKIERNLEDMGVLEGIRKSGLKA